MRITIDVEYHNLILKKDVFNSCGVNKTQSRMDAANPGTIDTETSLKYWEKRFLSQLRMLKEFLRDMKNMTLSISFKGRPEKKDTRSDLLN